MQLLLEILTKIGGPAAFLLLVGGAVWKGVTHYGGKWLDHRFEEKSKDLDRQHNEKLKQVEQRHDVMVRQLQSSIDREFDRAVRLHSKEFEALAEGWAVLHEAYWRARAATGRGQQVHSFAQMSSAQAVSFIERSSLADWQKQEMREFNDVEALDEYYVKANHWHQYARAMKARGKLVVFIDRHAIFIQPEIRAAFDVLERMASDALIEYKIRIEQAGPPFNFTRAEALRDDGEPIYKDLEKRIHSRLWSSSVQVAPAEEAATA